MKERAPNTIPVEGVKLRRQYVTQVKAEGADRELAFTVSTGAVDRHNDTVAPEGWEVDNFRRAGSVLWAHQQSSLPIAKPTFAAVVGGALKARAIFASAELYAFADTVYRMLLGGYLRATSVGFLPLEWSYDEQRGGFNIMRQELLEWSVVPVPANPEALHEAKHAGIDISPLKEWAEQTLDAESGPGLWVPRHLAEKAFAITAGNPLSVTVAGEQGSAGPHAPSTPGSSPGPATTEKAGRALSKANERRIKSARTAAASIAESLDEVLAAVANEETEESKTAVVPQTVLRLRQSPPTPMGKEAMARIVAETVAAEFRKARGRLD